MEVIELVKKKQQEIEIKVKKLGFIRVNSGNALEVITKELATATDKRDVYILLIVYKDILLHEKEVEFNKSIENMKYFLFEK